MENVKSISELQLEVERKLLERLSAVAEKKGFPEKLEAETAAYLNFKHAVALLPPK